MIKVLFVCHGNICRSPMAEYIMKKLIADSTLNGKVEAASKATHTDEIWNGRGNDIYPPAKKVLSSHGIPFEKREATLLEISDYDKYDMLIGMDRENSFVMNRMFPGDRKNKIYKLMSFAGKNDDVSDPWYTRDFERAYNDIYSGCLGLIEYLKTMKIK